MRMWIQAATVMSIYQGVATAAVVGAPESAAAPQIAKTGRFSSSGSRYPPDRTNVIYEFLERIGYIDFYNNYIEPFYHPRCTTFPSSKRYFPGLILTCPSSATRLPS